MSLLGPGLAGESFCPRVAVGCVGTVRQLESQNPSDGAFLTACPLLPKEH